MTGTLRISNEFARRGVWIWPSDYNSKAKCDAIITYCNSGNRITDLYPAAQDYDVNPATFTGNSTVANLSANTWDGYYPLEYLIEQATAIGVRVHAWFIIYIWTLWGSSSSALLTPLTDNATNHDTDSGGSILNFAHATPRGVVEDAITDLVTQNPGLTGVNLDYIRTDGVVTDIVDADITAFVSELRAKIPGIELSFCSTANQVTLPTYHQDGASWLSNDYVDTMISMGYVAASWKKAAYWNTCDFSGKRHLIGQSSETVYVVPSDLRASLIRYRDLGYKNYCLFCYSSNWDANGAVIDSLLSGSISITQGDITKIVNTPGTSFVITIDGSDYTTTAGDIAGLTTDGAVKAYVEGVEGERAEIHYRVTTGATLQIDVGDWSE